MESAKQRELRQLNLRIWAGEVDIFHVKSSQDASLKKNTAFIKRLRTAISQSNVSTFIQEVGNLSLHKYLSEIISACYEGLLRLKIPADVAAGVEVVSALHQRFGPVEFTAYLGWLIGRGLSTPDKTHLKTLTAEVREREEKERLARQRILLRVATELWLAGVLRSLEDVARPESESKGREASKVAEPTARTKAVANSSKQGASHDPFPLEVLKDLLGHDREHATLPLVVLFVKTFSWDVLGIQTRAVKKVTPEPEADLSERLDDVSQSDSSSTDSEPSLLSDDLHQRFKNVLLRYFEDVKAHIVREQKIINVQAKRNAEAYVRSGEVFEDRQATFDKQNKAQEKLIANAQVIADVLGEEMPDLNDKEASQSAADGTVGLVKAADYLKSQGDAGIWADEEERRFYEGLMDLGERVPAVLLDDNKKKKSEIEDGNGKKQEASSSNAEPTAESLADSIGAATSIVNRSIGAQVDGLLARLPELHSKDGVDQFAIDFCFVNSKASRNRLIKTLLDVPKGRTDLLPLYARIITTLNKYMPDITAAVIAHLDEEFRSLQRRKTKEFLGSVRLQNVRYFAELTKFGVVPEHIIFHCFKVCLDELNRVNVEILGSLMENCGRYLLRNEDTSPRMISFLEILQRKRVAQHLDQRERLVIENAIYYVNPPERPAIEQKDRSPIELYVVKIIHDDLTKRSVEKITKQIRKLHWEEPEIVAILEKVFTKPWKIKYNNVHLLAVILGSLQRYHPQFAVTCIDDVLEQITNGLEFYDTKFNQRRSAQAKYLGELYVYRMIDSSVIFDTMYKIITFGHEGGTPRPDSDNPWDVSDDYFRIRLICILLETCGGFFDKGPLKLKLDFFLAFFQYYFNTKDKLPPDIEFAIQDAFAAISPSLRLITDLDEASQKFADAVKENYKNQPEEPPVELEDADEEFVSEGEDDEQAQDEHDDKSSGDENDGPPEGHDSDTSALSDDEEEQIIVTRLQQEQRDPELDADFDRELAKLMSDSIDARKLERKTLFDVPLPMRKKERDANLEEPFDDGQAIRTDGGTSMKFSLLSKRGNKQQTRDIDLPADSSFAVAMRDQQHLEKLEQKRIKDIVLNLDLRDDSDGTDGNIDRDPPNPYLQPRMDKAGKGRANQRGRQLQVSDLDWT